MLDKMVVFGFLYWRPLPSIMYQCQVQSQSKIERIILLGQNCQFPKAILNNLNVEDISKKSNTTSFWLFIHIFKIKYKTNPKCWKVNIYEGVWSFLFNKINNTYFVSITYKSSLQVSLGVSFEYLISECWVIKLAVIFDMLELTQFQFKWHNKKTSQELRMLSSVTLNCQVTQIVMNSGSQLSKL